MGSPSLRTFLNRIVRAEMQAASLRSAAFFRSPRPAGTHPGLGKARGPGREAPLPSLTSSVLCPSESTENLAGPSSAQNYGDFKDLRGGGGGWGNGMNTTTHRPSTKPTIPWLRKKLELWVLSSQVGTTVELADSCGRRSKA